jgi:TM2 domain-containing membrane protein YozV
MSVDLSRLSAHLSADQQAAVRRAYRQRAKSATTAFLLCFFLGIFGAHAFYLGRKGQGILRLILSPLIIPGLIWELIDLFHIDHDVYEQNLKVAEDLVAQAVLAVPNASLEAEALARLDALVHERETRATPPAYAAQEAAGPVLLAAVTEPISADADVHAPADADAPPEPAAPTPPIWPIAEDAAAAYHTAPWGGAAETAREAFPLDAEQTPAVHLEPSQPAPDAAPMWAAWPTPLGAREVNQTAEVADRAAPAADADGTEDAALDALTRPDGASDDADITAAMVAFAAALADEEAPLVLGESPAGELPGFAVAAEREPTVVPVSAYDTYAPPAGEQESSGVDTAATSEAPPRAPRRAADLTDSVAPPDAPPLADVGEGAGAPVRVVLPQSAAAMSAAAAAASWAVLAEETTPQSWNEPTDEFAVQGAAGGFASADGVEEDVPRDADLESSTLVLVTDDEGDAPGREGETPRTLAELAATTPVWAADATPAADAAAAGAAYESHITEVEGDHEAGSSKRIVKRVRVVRRLVVNGQVVHEATAEQVVDADADTDATARNLQATLGSADPQTLASLATQEYPEEAPGSADGPSTTR